MTHKTTQATPDQAVLAHIVTFNHQECISPVVESLLRQRGVALRVVVTDNGSTDGTVEALRELASKSPANAVEVRYNTENIGFSAAHNRVLSEFVWNDTGRANEFICVVNPDMVLDERCLQTMAEAFADESRVGIVTPKLLRCSADLKPLTPPIVDAAGMYITPSIRHFDRGSGEEDRGQYQRREYVFGATGALAMFSRPFLRDISYQDEVFDPFFFAYREDADLSWRAQWLGWRVLYEPRAVAYHRRKVLPERRGALSAAINRLGVQNRFLLQWKNLTWRGMFSALPAVAVRNLVVIGAVLLQERSSLPGLLRAFRLIPEMRARRQAVRLQARSSPLDVARWFSRRALPALSSEPSPCSIRRVVACIVNYNSGECARKAVHALLTKDNRQDTPPRESELHVVVFDNASTDGSAALLEAHHDVTVVHHPENLGFSGAINRVVRDFRADAYLLLNPDVEISRAAVETLVSVLNRWGSLGAITPVLCNNDSSRHLGFLARRFPSLFVTLLEAFGLHRAIPNNPWSAHYRYLDDSFLEEFIRGTQQAASPAEPLDRPLLVEQPAGACVLFRSEALQELGGFDEQFYPAWFEDVDLFQRMHQSPWHTAITREATAVHGGGQSAKQMPRIRFSQIFITNQLRYWSKHGSRPAYLAVRALLPLALIVRGVLGGGGKNVLKHALNLLVWGEAPREREDQIHHSVFSDERSSPHSQ